MAAAPTITIAAEDDLAIKPAPSAGAPDLGGIYHARNLSRTRRPGSRTASRASHERRSEHLNVEDDGDDWLRDDGRKKQVFKGTTLLWYRSSLSPDSSVTQTSLRPLLIDPAYEG